MTARIPVVQAGMGVQVAKSELAAAVARAGGIGCISSVGLGSLEASLANYIEESNLKLTQEIRRARELAPEGILAVNAMVALFNYKEIVEVCVKEKVDMIISGAGLPLPLPGIVGDADIKLVPVVSSGRSMSVIMKAWHRKFNRIPDAVIVEGPKCGGHMAFSWEQLDHPDQVPIAAIRNDVKKVLEPFEAEYGRTIPILGAEGIVNHKDVLSMLELGFDGVQVGTRFICTEESGIDPRSKDIYVKAKDEDVTLIQSPLGLPVKVLRTPLVQRLQREEKIPFGCPFLCLRACGADKARFCLADALVNTLFGNIDEALFMTGSSVGRVNDIIPAEEFFEPFKEFI